MSSVLTGSFINREEVLTLLVSGIFLSALVLCIAHPLKSQLSEIRIFPPFLLT